jgi:endonuclease G
VKGEEQLQLRSWIEQVQLKDHVARSAGDPNVPSALDKLEKGQSLDDAQANSLEALILQDARPALVVSEGGLEVLPDLWKSLEPARPMIEQVSAAVGRINVSGLPGLLFAGTGFLVGEDLVMTTRTVAERFATGLGTSDLAIRSDRMPSIHFHNEGTAGEGMRITRVEMIHPFLDMALLRLPFTGITPLMLSL